MNASRDAQAAPKERKGNEIRKLTSNSVREQAGREGKIGGHKFEVAYAEHLGLPPTAVYGGTKTKIDILGGKLGNISVKNPSKNHTQIFLTSPKVFAKKFELPVEVIHFTDLFFGTPNHDEYESLLRKHKIAKDSLSETAELRRKRVLGKNIPLSYTEKTISWLNSNNPLMFEVLFSKGYPDWVDRADLLGWAWKKNDVKSVTLYKMDDLYDIFQKGRWHLTEDSSTLWFLSGNRKYLHLQMKGSGPKDSWGYHSMMFHMYAALLETSA